MDLLASPRLRRAAPLLAIGAACLVTYANSLAGSFHFDDAHAIVENPWIRSFRFLPRWFTDAQTFSVLPQNQDWRPLVLIAHALCYAIGGGLAPWAFHLLNLAIHIACACLTFLIARILFSREEAGRAKLPEGETLALALLAGLLFAVHPLQTETVDYLSSRSEGLTALGILAGFYCHLRGRDLPALGWFAFGLSAKAVAIVLPALCYLEELLPWEAAASGRWLPLLRFDRRRVLRYAGYAAVAAAYLALRHFLVSDFSVQSRATTGRLDYAMTEVRAYWHYLGLFLFPVGQSGDANYRVTTSALEPDFLRALAAGLVLFGAAFALRRRAPIPVFGLLWFVIILSPTSTVLPLAEAVNEHRPYAGVAGLAWAAAWLFGRLPHWARGTIWERPRVRASAAALALFALMACSWTRNRVWHDDIALWSDVVEKSQDNGRAHLNLGLALAGVGRQSEALAQYQLCASAWPGYAYCPLDRGVLLGSQGKTDEALAAYAQAERLDPQLFWIPYYKGMLLRIRDAQASARELRRATKLSPGFPAAHRELASTLFVLGDRAGARAELDRTLSLDPADGEAIGLRGLLEELAGDRAAAKADDRRALTLRPDLAQPRVNLGWMAEEDHELAAARDWYESATRAAPRDADGWRRLARVEGALGDAPKAQVALAQAATLTAPAPRKR